MKIQPARGYYVIDIPETKATSHGLQLADTATNSAPVIGTITAVPEDNEMYQGAHKVGTQVVFRKYAIDELKYQTPDGEQKVWILDARDILGTVIV